MVQRPRRLRATAAIRGLVREIRLDPASFVLPVFVVEGAGVEREIPSMPGVFHHSVDRLPPLMEKLRAEGIESVLLFGVPEQKDACGSGAYAEYAMVKAAAARGWVDERAAAMEMLTAIRRAGADILITCFARDAARWLRE